MTFYKLTEKGYETVVLAFRIQSTLRNYLKIFDKNFDIRKLVASP
jgi:hypothetical protein